MNPYSLLMSEIKPLTDIEKVMLSKMRGLIFRNMPYMTHVGMVLPVRSLNGQGANLITKSGVIILDFVALSEWTERTQAAELAQLWLHWLLNHDKRFDKILDKEGVAYGSPWWVATDCAIHQLLEENNRNVSNDRQLTIPWQMANKAAYGLKSDTAEDLYFELIDKMIDEKMKNQGQGDSGDQGPDSGDDSGSGSDLDQELQDLLNGGNSPMQGKPGSGTPGISEDSEVPHFYNGSGVGAENSDYDAAALDADPSLKSEMIPDWQKTMVQKATADSMKEYSRGKSAGTLPGEFERWADELFAPPKINWRTVFRNTLRNELSRRSGVSDFTWAKLPKDRGSMGGVIQPRMASYVPGKVGVFIDTSGSMSEHDLAIALNEVKGILVDYDVVAYAIDVGAHELGPIANIQDFKLLGGGGTDMGIAIEKSVEDKLEVAVIMTDGETPWRPRPERSNLFAVAAIITHQDEDSYVMTGVPDWMSAVHIPATHGMDV